MRTLVTAILLAFLAGCSDGPSNGPTIDPGSSSWTASVSSTETNCPDCPEPLPRPSGTPSTVQLFGCTVFLATFTVGSSQMASELPTGYEPSGDGVVAQTIGLDAWMCEQAVIDNVSVVPQVSLFTVSGLVQAPSERAHPDLDDLYVFELVCDSDIIRGAFAAANITVLPGSVTLTTMDPTGNLLYEQQGATYEFQLAGDMARSGDAEDDMVRVHQGTSYYDVRDEGTASTFENAGAVRVEGGALSRLLPPPGTATAAVSSSGTVDLTFQFYSPEEIL